MKFLKILVLIVVLNVCQVLPQNVDSPKNIIILIGDGMGTNHVSAAVLNFPDNPFVKFNSVGLSITRAANKLVTDSAPGATVFSTGCRTNYRYIGVDTAGHRLTSLFELAYKKRNCYWNSCDLRRNSCDTSGICFACY
jgi:alkaline phosphatase